MEPYELYDDAFILPESNIGIISDLHFNHEFSNQQYISITNKIKQIIDQYNLSILIFNGDTFTEFPFPQKGIDTIRNIQELVDEIILITGNHEEKVGGFGQTFSDDQNITISDQYIFDDITIYHGHAQPPTDTSNYIIGHFHPTKIVNERPTPVYLQGEEKINDSMRTVFILPSFTKTINIDYNEFTTSQWISDLQTYTILENNRKQ